MISGDKYKGVPAYVLAFAIVDASTLARPRSPIRTIPLLVRKMF